MITVKRKVRFGQGGKGRKKALPEAKGTKAPVGRVPRVARLVALAIRFDQLIRDGEVADQAELARVGHVTRARLTQIMNLLSLAPDIQEAVLHLEPRCARVELSERRLRPIVAEVWWSKQRKLWESDIQLLERPRTGGHE